MLGGIMHTCAHVAGWVLFTWELRRKARGRRWFYVQLEGLLAGLPPENWRGLGGSVYLVRAEHSNAFRLLLKRFDGPELKWYEFKVEA